MMSKLWRSLALSIVLSGGFMLAQGPQSQEPPAQQQSQSDQQITGKIVKSDEGKFVLVESSGTMYQLDDQDAAKKYESKKVTVTGSLDASGSTIHVTHIEAAK